MRKPYALQMIMAIPVALIMHVTLLQRIRVWGAAPDAVGALATSLGMLYGPGAGFFAGAAGGIYMDLLGSRFIGLLGLTRGLMGFAAGLAARRVFKENLLMTGLVGFVTAFSADMLGALVIRGLGVPFDVLRFSRVAFAAGCLNMVATPVAFYVLWRAKVRIDSYDSPVIVE